MIASAGISLFIMTLYGERHLPADLTTANIPAFFIFLAAFIVMRKFKPGPIKVMMLSGLAGVIVYSII